MLKDEQSAYDAMHEVFLKIILNHDRLTGDYPSALLYRIATNICLNRIRSQQRYETRENLDVLQHMSFFGESDHNESARKLLDYILRKEKKPLQKVAVMYFLDGMTIKEIAQEMKMSSSGIHKQLVKLRNKIREKGDL
jgi:RNA polymerase sigma-70 factor (ECF subfamily)